MTYELLISYFCFSFATISEISECRHCIHSIFSGNLASLQIPTNRVIQQPSNASLDTISSICSYLFSYEPTVIIFAKSDTKTQLTRRIFGRGPSIEEHDDWQTSVTLFDEHMLKYYTYFENPV